MICRGGTIADDSHPQLIESLDGTGRSTRTAARDAGWPAILVGMLAVAALLAILPGRSQVAPLVESDYCYQFIAVERAADGLGFTSLQPVAPRQPWEPRYDFGFLTQWPVGYPFLIWFVRAVSGVTTLVACQWVSVLACGAAIVGWFTWTRSCLPDGMAAWLLAAMAAITSVSVDRLVNPSTDLLLIAGVPFVLLLTATGVRDGRDSEVSSPPRWRLLLAGLVAGSLIWFRYAAVFLPVGVAMYLLGAATRRRGNGTAGCAFFVLGAGAPLLGLLILNGMLGVPQSLQSQLNLGSAATFAPSVSDLATAWCQLTNVGDALPFHLSPLASALAPAVVWGVALSTRRVRQELGKVCGAPRFLLSAFTVASLLLTLLVVTAVFPGKYHYVSLSRYYEPVRPLYLALVLAPVFTAKRPLSYIASIVALLAVSSAAIANRWAVPYTQVTSRTHEATSFGQKAVAFSPGADELYRWLRAQDPGGVIIFSNFHEYITLETKLPAGPLPRTSAQLAHWTESIARLRDIENPRVLLVIDPDNRWRSYFLPKFETVVAELGLNASGLTRLGNAYVFEVSSVGHSPTDSVAEGTARAMP